ncbi:hypothetical protein AWB85_18025 [Mycobacteroides immunogenum]|uniref:Uncharacterized protein n=1 Tax=Mycobacteroides immunogenum TaxID=83262 RepID=A0A179V6J0_9MYCO|nr:hypothetical protein AWB85_18025 [Mycobacteroides immunogenum]
MAVAAAVGGADPIDVPAAGTSSARCGCSMRPGLIAETIARTVASDIGGLTGPHIGYRRDS